MAPRYSLAKKRAIDLLREARVKKPPVSIEKLAELVKAAIRYEPFAGQLYGMVHRNSDGTAVIGVNSMDAPNRQRFTIAHEIGHLLLHKDEHLHVDEKSPIGLRNDRSSLAIDEREIEANQFAAELLMPVELLEKDLGRLPDDIETEEAVTRLARLYQVSEQAMTVRLTALKVLS
jgi:Zn-dependent peptidase ImmA (M78 family)